MYSIYCNIGIINLCLCWIVKVVGMDDARCLG
jgi:hypothetical protein